MRILGTIEARMGSTRLPGKTMAMVYHGMPLLDCVVRRFQLCKQLDGVVVATSVEANDDEIADWCTAHRVDCFRGSEEDVLARVAGAAIHHGADAIVQMGADSAYLDFELIDQLIMHYRSGKYDYVCNDLKLTYPLGIYGHVVSVEKLTGLAQRSDLTEKDRSDVVRYIWEHPEQYRMLNLEAPAEFFHPELRLTIDYPEDMEQARAVYAYFDDYKFTTRQVLELYRQQPALFAGTRSLVQQSAPFLGKS